MTTLKKLIQIIKSRISLTNEVYMLLEYFFHTDSLMETNEILEREYGKVIKNIWKSIISHSGRNYYVRNFILVFFSPLFWETAESIKLKWIPNAKINAIKDMEKNHLFLNGLTQQTYKVLAVNLEFVSKERLIARLKVKIVNF